MYLKSEKSLWNFVDAKLGARSLLGPDFYQTDLLPDHNAIIHLR